MEKENERNIQSGKTGSRAGAEMKIDPEEIKRDLDSGRAFRRGNRYPYAVFIICASAALGHLLGTYVFHDALTCTSVGMVAGIVLSVIYGRFVYKDNASESEKA